jgi:hypothetical protein
MVKKIISRYCHFNEVSPKNFVKTEAQEYISLDKYLRTAKGLKNVVEAQKVQIQAFDGTTICRLDCVNTRSYVHCFITVTLCWD